MMRLGLITCLLGAAACGDRGLTVNYNNQDPEVSIQWPTPDLDLPANSTLVLVAIVADPETEPEELSVTWTSSLDGPLANGEWTRVGEEVSLSLPNGLSEGEHTLTIAVADEDGATASASVDMSAVPNEAPLVTILAPAVEDNVVIRTDEQYRMELTVSDDADSPGNLTVEWSGTLAAAADLPTTFNADGTMGVILPTLEAGPYVASISVRDRYGAEGYTQTTLTVIVDEDHDGVAAEDDCDDDDANSFPGAVDVCDGVDNDCDGIADNNPPIWYLDSDDDQFGTGVGVQACDAPQDHVADNTDCDDEDTNQFPGADEVCNGEDDDCNDLVDDDPIDAIAYYPDTDNDGEGEDAAVVYACEAPSGIYVETPGDCDDNNVAINTAATEVCDDVDNDCDDRIDEEPPTWFTDDDDDGYGLTSSGVTQCEPPTPDAVQLSNDCDDDNIAINPGATEICNDIDDNCSGSIDDSSTEGIEWYTDLDGDGFGDPESVVLACDQPENTSERPFDCDDSDPTKNPTAEELCNNEDDDCDGNIEDALWAGEDHPYPTPMAAVRAAVAGDMVCVDSGVYTETMNFGGKNLRVMGVDRDTVIMQSSTGPRFTSNENATSLLAHMTFDPRPADGSSTTPVSCGGLGCALAISNASPALRDLRIAGFAASSRNINATVSVSGGAATFEDIEFADMTTTQGHINGAVVTGVFRASNWQGSGHGMTFTNNQTLRNNTYPYASTQGLAMFLHGGSATLEDVTITGNTASAPSTNHGTIYINGGTHHFERLRVIDNTLNRGQGGALFVTGSANVTINNGLLADNYVTGSTTYGGAIAMQSGSVTLNNVDIIGNTVSGSHATNCGGGVIGHTTSTRASVTMTNTIAVNNTATCGGVQRGGMVATGPSSTLSTSLTLTMSYSNLYDNGVPENVGSFHEVLGQSVRSVDPGYRNIFVQDSLQWDVGLLSSSPMRNTGDPTIENSDGSRSHLGSTGGPYGTWPTE